MSKALRLLLLEDSEHDALFVLRELRRGGYELVFERVDSAAGFKAALNAQEWELIIADYSLPQFTATEALRLLQGSGIDLPFIIVSGAIGEEVAVAAMRSGAHDYLLKDSLTRLVPAVERELREARARHERQRAEEGYLRLAAIVESSGDAIIGRALDGIITSWNQGAERLFGYTAGQVRGHSTLMLLPPERLEEETDLIERLKRGERIEHFETVRVRMDGRRIVVSLGISPIKDAQGRIVGVSIIARDITERKRAETCIAALSKLGQNLSSASTPREAAYIIGNIADDLFGWDAFTLDLYFVADDSIRTVLNVDTISDQRQEVPSTYLGTNPSPVARQVIEHGAELILREGTGDTTPGLIAFGDTARPSASMMFVPVRNQAKVIGILSVQSYTPKAYERRDLSTLQTLADYCGGALERIRVREEWRESEERFRRVVESDMVGILFWSVAGGISDANDKLLSMIGYTREDLKAGRVNWAAMTPPEHQHLDLKGLAEVAATGTCTPFEKEFIRKDGTRVPILLGAAGLKGAKDQGVCFVLDITARKLAEEELSNSRGQLRALAAHLQSVREEERKRITREIHDELGQSLTGFKMDLAWMRNRLRGEEGALIRQPLLEKIGTMGTLLDGMASLMRKLCTELRPGVLDDLGLIAAIEWQTREYQNRTGIQCTVKLELGDLSVDPERSTALFRILQEILTNVARHARASRVEVLLKPAGNQLLLEVKDNGRGIKENEKSGSKSLGLLGLRERAVMLGGEVEIEGRAGKGTTVRVNVPLPQVSPERMEQNHGPDQPAWQHAAAAKTSN